MKNSIWQELKQKGSIIGLSPMDGVTDLTMRSITATYGQPDLMMTEFVNVEGLIRGPKRLWKELWTLPENKSWSINEKNVPVIAQLYGLDPKNFQAVAQKIIQNEIPGLESLTNQNGIKGIDLNMGCPAKNVTHNGAGAGLIKNKDLAREIFFATKEGAKDELPVSIKTRIGYNSKDEAENWLGWILEELKPATLTIHGRTYKQGYTGLADWEVIKIARKLKDEIQKNIADDKKTLILGNGDIQSRHEANERIEKTGVDGVLIGRGAMGNPWCFLEKSNQENRSNWIKIMIEHAELYEKIYGHLEKYSFLPMRKHLAWYAKGMTGASKIRVELCQTNSSLEVKQVLQKFKLL